jgi:hypothetical protein
MHPKCQQYILNYWLVVVEVNQVIMLAFKIPFGCAIAKILQVMWQCRSSVSWYCGASMNQANSSQCFMYIPVVPHKAVAEVSKIGNL